MLNVCSILIGTIEVDSVMGRVFLSIKMGITGCFEVGTTVWRV